jgi:ribosomal-protein-alanine N-acetyltransferase
VSDRPERVLAPSPPRFLVARGDVSHVAACATLESVCFGAPWTAEALHEELGAATLLLIAREQRELSTAGVASSSADAVDAYALLRLTPPDAELLRLAVHPRSRRRGAAGELLTAALAELRRHGCERWWLEVRRDNGPALGLYRRFGFELVATRRRYYADGCDAQVLRLTCQEAPSA